MSDQIDEPGFPSGRVLTLTLAVVLVVVSLFYFYDVQNSPSGFYIDESSIAYNAHLISRTGRDEYGTSWPLYFKTFGDYKNPTYIYLLAAVFRITGPGIHVARLLSATLGLLSAFVLGLLAWKISRRLNVALIIAISALLTPWLFEGTRLVFEVAIYPMILALFLLAVRRVVSQVEWKNLNVIAVAVTLALLTYSYSVGRLLGPLLAAGLILLLSKSRRIGLLKTWALYLVLLIPLFIFQWRNPGALSGRFYLLTYISPETGLAEIGLTFIRQYLTNINPWRWLITGENNIRDHVEGIGSLLFGSVILGLFGLFLIFKHKKIDAWWRFIFYALIVSIVPAALTRTDFPQLRLIAFPVIFHVLMVPAAMWLTEAGYRRLLKGAVLVALLAVMVIQGAYFFWLFHSTAASRWYVFDARFSRKVLEPALSFNQSPIYLFDAPGNSGYIQALWHGTLQSVDPARFVRLPVNTSPPPGSLVISTEEDCSNCRLLAKSVNYTVYAVPPLDIRISVPALPPDGLRSQIIPIEIPGSMMPGDNVTLNIHVKNLSSSVWPAVGEWDGRHAVTLRARWLNADGAVFSELETGARLPYDLEPGDTAGVLVKTIAPQTPGRYTIEIGVVQESATALGGGGSTTLKWLVNVEVKTAGE